MLIGDLMSREVGYSILMLSLFLWFPVALLLHRAIHRIATE